MVGSGWTEISGSSAMGMLAAMILLKSISSYSGNAGSASKL